MTTWTTVKRAAGCVAIATLALAGGCAGDGAGRAEARGVATAAVAEEVTWRGWPAVRLANDEVEAIVVPAIGRVMSFKLAGSGEGGNVLWTNPQIEGVLPEPGPNWQNFGGDKAWPWPQNARADAEGWPGQNWPPPFPFRGFPYEAELVDGGVVLRLDAGESPFGVEVTRRIRLDGEASLLVETVLDPIGEVAVKAGAWHVTQIEREGSEIVVVGRPNQTLEAATEVGDEAPAQLGRFVQPLPAQGRRGARAVEPLDGGFKAFFNADVLAAGMVREGRGLVYLQEVVVAEGGRDLRDVDRAQVYVAGPSTGEVSAWSELEFAAPVGGDSRLAVRWTLIPTTPHVATDDAAVAELVIGRLD